LLIYLEEWSEEHPGEKYTNRTIFYILLKQLRGILTYSMILYFLEMIFKFGFSIMLNLLFRAVADA
jgi:hypothetical protein